MGMVSNEIWSFIIVVSVVNCVIINRKISRTSKRLWITNPSNVTLFVVNDNNDIINNSITDTEHLCLRNVHGSTILLIMPFLTSVLTRKSQVEGQPTAYLGYIPHAYLMGTPPPPQYGDPLPLSQEYLGPPPQLHGPVQTCSFGTPPPSPW